MRGRSLNINEGGIGGVFIAGWEVGTSVGLQFSVPIATDPVRVRARSYAIVQATAMDLSSWI